MKICRYSVIWHNAKGTLRYFDSNNLTAVNRVLAGHKGASVYEFTRYDAMSRLQLRYLKLKSEGRLPKEIDYPQFIGL